MITWLENMDIPMGGFTQQSVGPALIELHAGIEKGDKREILQMLANTQIPIEIDDPQNEKKLARCLWTCIMVAITTTIAHGNNTFDRGRLVLTILTWRMKFYI